jgi:type II secretory pathway component PulF
MTQYRYNAVDSEGEPAAGTIEAGSAREATARLQERGFTVNRMERADGGGGILRVSKRLGWDELSLFSEQLNAMVRSGLPLPATLKALAAGMKQPRMREALEGIRTDLERGLPLHEAIERRHDAFPRIYPALIKAGEQSGNLPGVLQLLSRYTAHAAQQRQEMIAALAYPVILLVVLFGVFVYFSEEVFPEIKVLATSDTGNFLQDIGFRTMSLATHRGNEVSFAMVALLALFFVARFLLNRTEVGRYRLDWLRLRMPTAGKAHYLGAMSRMNETLAILLRARVPIVESLELAGAASGSPVMQRALNDASGKVSGGERIADSLMLNPLFTSDYCWLLAAAEDRGDLEEALDSFAQRYSAEAESQDKVWAALMNSGLIVGVGAVVLVFFLGLYGPLIFGAMPF